MQKKHLSIYNQKKEEEEWEVGEEGKKRKSKWQTGIRNEFL